MKQPQTLLILPILILTVIVGRAQVPTDPYAALWEKVGQLENDELTKSALKEVEAISKKAEREKNSAQMIKALLFTSKYALTLEEDAQLNIVHDFRAHIEKAEFPTKNVLESYLANLYWQYFQENRYPFYDRTKTANKIDSTDFRTWDLTTLFHEIGSHFEASLENKEQLQETNLDGFDKILDRQPGSETFRPSLFDLLAHAALDFYRTGENNITRPADRFEIDNPEILCEAKEFTQQEIDTKDRTSLQVKALLVYQELVKFHLSDTTSDALADLDIERLNYIHQNAIFPNKDEIFLEVLQNSAENLKENKVSGLYQYELARLYYQQGKGYDPKSGQENRWKQKEALEVCESIIAQFPDSRGAKKCKMLKSRILAPDLQLTTETYIPVDTDVRLLVDYKNIDALDLTALKISQKELEKLNGIYPQAKQLEFLKKLTVAKKWEAKLKNEKDYQGHGIEILFPALSNGQYVILATPLDKEGKNSQDNTFAFSSVQVTDMALITTRTQDSHLFQVADRVNGLPISGAQVQLTYRMNYNKPYRNKTFVTDKKGMIKIVPSQENWSDVKAMVSYKNEKAHFGPYYVNRKYGSDDRPKRSYAAFLFTDRSIYRPAQPLYFKGIVIENYDGKSKVAAEENVSVILYDANGQEVSDQNFATNEFGSFSGEFILPDNGLTGEYYIEFRGTARIFGENHYFSVEEYKRPKFETSFEPITETFRVNDSITVMGSATAYAGSPITDAKVSYRVKRAVYFPSWYYWHHPYFEVTPQEIADGETLTDASGNYTIDFKALPDSSISKENLPTFRYEVIADVTDINGETHTATTVVAVGYHAINASIEVPDQLNKDTNTESLTITTNNLNGEQVPASGTLKMYKLQAPDDVLRARPWEAPDYKLWEQKAFKALFPHDAFTDEDDTATWDKGKMIWKTDFDTEKATEIPLPDLQKWAAGRYVIELEATDKFGQEVKALAQTTLFGDSDKKPTDKQLFQITTDKKIYAVGETVEVEMASASQYLTVSIFVEKDHKIVDTRIVNLSDNSKSFTVPVTSDDLGGFAINYSFSAYNSFRSGSLSIEVPYPKTDLSIETLTFRDKLEPGTDETWAFTIKGPKGDKVSSEILASMYDASLDAFREHTWDFDPLMRSTYYSNIYIDAQQSFGTSPFRVHLDNDTFSFAGQRYDSFDWFGFYFGSWNYRSSRISMLKRSAPVESMVMETEYEEVVLNEVVMEDSSNMDSKQDGFDDSDERFPERKKDEEKELSFEDMRIRKNLRETAFFFPQLRTDKEGNVSFNFTTPEALTKWKLQLLAHTKTLESAVTTLEAVTQKELMVMPNAPRYLREGDEISISTKIANLTQKTLSGQAKLVLTDALTNEDISTQLLISLPDEGNAGQHADARRNFKVDSLGNTQVKWRVRIPDGIQAVQYMVIAKAGDFSDGEQNLLPVLTNRMLVTETLPMWVRSNQTKTFQLDKLKDNTSSTLKNHRLTLEITSNPAWYAVQALPYLMEYPYECNEQIFARYYANSLASHIANSNPRIQEVFKQWANSDALISNLEKNEELKSILIQETPWLRDGQSETEQKKRIALLFDLNKMKNERANALNKLKTNQKPSGAWAWFNGGPDSRFITQHIVTGLGHLRKLTGIGQDPGNTPSLKVDTSGQSPENLQIIQNAMTYLDAEFVEEFDQMKKYTENPNDDHLSRIQIQYLYMRSFFPNIKTTKEVDRIMTFYKGQAQKYWKNQDLYPKGMLALTLQRMGDTETSGKIMRALEENSITSDELGMYWAANKASWHWYRAPVETQALMIEAFEEIHPDGEQEITKTIDNLKVWLLKHKQTDQWSTTKATTDAIYALLLQGSDWLSVTDAVDVLVGGERLEPFRKDGNSGESVNVEAGTGYYKTSWNTKEIEPKMAEVQLSKKGEGVAWGALYWQYFEDLDKITSAETPLKLKKKLFLKKNTDTGEEIFEINAKSDLQVGDLVRVRIELRADRDMEFLHMKDMRAAGFEPINVLSEYKSQDGLGYYESIKDASTNFFFDRLPKGVYVFEYDLRVNNAGEFSNGITTIQSMYAPEFSSHSEGVRVEVRDSR